MLSSVENSSKHPDFQDVLLSFFFFFLVQIRMVLTVKRSAFNNYTGIGVN